MGGSIGGRCRISGLALLLCVVLLSTTMANGIRTGGVTTVGTGAPAGPAAAAINVAPPPPPAVAAVATAVPSERAAMSEDSKRKVPNGPDPIHNRRPRWGDAPARRV